MKDNRSPERKAFCNRVLLNARQIYDNIWKDTEWHSKAHDQKIDSEISKELLLKPAAELLETLAIAHKDNSSALCLWVFDEVANMNAEYLTTLRRTILIFQKLPMWTFLLSTNSAIGRLITAQHDDPSARVRSLQLNRFLPFLALPVDIEYNRRLSDPSLRTIELYKPMNQFATVDHMTCFGRPLWGSYISADVKEIQEFVEYKLLGARPIARLSSEQNIWVRQVFALIAARICLDPAMNSKEAVDLANEAVNTHLRLVVGWEEDHRMIETVSPAEPLVADAAANVLMRKDEQGKYTWVRVIKAVVVKLLSGGLISKGLKGEIFARLICTLSADFAREARRMNVVGEEFPFSQPIRLKDFLINMFGKDIIHRLQEVSGRRSQYDSRLRQQTTVPDFETCLGEAYINFNHFTFTTQSLPPNDPNVMQTMVAQLLRRHEALQLCENQPHWDLLIPVYLGSLNEAFDNVKTTVIVIQVKNRLRKTTPITRARDFRTHFSAHQKPMMYILLDLRVDFELSVHTVPGTNVFCITARGAMMDTFPCMVCKRLVTCCLKNWTSNHARQNHQISLILLEDSAFRQSRILFLTAVIQRRMTRQTVVKHLRKRVFRDGVLYCFFLHRMCVLGNYGCNKLDMRRHTQANHVKMLLLPLFPPARHHALQQ